MLVFIKTKKIKISDTELHDIYKNIQKLKEKNSIYYTSTEEISTGYSIPNPNVYIQDVTEVTSFCTLLSSGNSSCITMSSKT